MAKNTKTPKTKTQKEYRKGYILFKSIDKKDIIAATLGGIVAVILYVIIDLIR